MKEKRTAVLLILDGLGDRPVPELDGETPLLAAKTPTLDRLAAEGQNGLLDVLGPGLTPGSDAAHLALFGYRYSEVYPGRGPLEALGAGLASKPGDVAFRANFATVDDDLKVVDRRAGREFTEEESRALQDALDGLEIDGVKVHFLATVQHRGALILEGRDLSGEITDTDPHEEGVKILKCRALTPEASKTASVVNKLTQIAQERFGQLRINTEREKRGINPANALLLRGPGKHEEIPTLHARYDIKSAVLAGGALYIGTAKYVGMEHIPVEGQTGTIDTNFDNIAAEAIECIKSDYDYVFLHIKATDNASHDGDIKKKILAIERTDSMLQKILDEVGDQVVIAVTGDHSTPVAVGTHTCDPTPILLWSSFIRSDAVKRFSEFDASNGALHTLCGIDVMPLLLGYAGKIEKTGA
ncbi:MAG: 2,3-bisphosphoglycerate-independent phosphoglycerate mutase [Candidatus Thorarchaeota archaeon]|jgi:2,3-bisphosphoglycerate-independent phosphoglycerate mutase